MRVPKIDDIYYREMVGINDARYGMKVRVINNISNHITYTILDIVKPNSSNDFKSFNVGDTTGFVYPNRSGEFIPWSEYEVSNELREVIEGD